jgi:integrase
VVWVDGTKNRNAKRRLALESATVRELLLRRIAALGAEALVFSTGERDRPLPTDSLYKALAKFCKCAGVPEVCPHSLRGLHSSLAVQVGITSAAVAQALGHASDAVTRRHYIAASALDAVRSQTVAAALIGDRDLDNLRATLLALPSAQLDRLCASLGYRR